MTWLAVHPGLGDHFCILGLVSDLVYRGFPVTVFALERDRDTVVPLYDSVGAAVAWCESYKDACRQAKAKASEGGLPLILGMGSWSFCESRDRLGSFDQAFYAQARVEFRHKYAVPAQMSALGNQPSQAPKPEGPYFFVHDDPARGYRIDLEKLRLPHGFTVVRPERVPGESIFHWRAVMAGAREIHVIDSAFLNWLAVADIDHGAIYWHTYARPDGDPPHVPEWISRID